MANSYFYSNTAVQTTLTGSVTAGATTINVAATTGFPAVPFTLALDYGAVTEELVKVTAVAGLGLTVERGFSGTSAQSHSLGAVVRHVWHAGDATDMRTHEASVGAVHGLTGSIVGTTDTQTLTNKTLTSPTINSGTLSGTFAGTHTYSGAVTHSAGVTNSSTTALSGGGSLAGTFTGTPTLSGAVLFTGSPIFQGAAASTVITSHRVSGDSTPRLQIQADGKHLWGTGSGAADVNLYREGADTLTTDDIFRVIRASDTDNAISVRLTTDTTNSHWYMEASGKQWWGAGGASAVDTNLYRSAANTLKTDDDLVIKTHKALYGEGNVRNFSFSSQTSSTASITFATPFSAVPHVHCNINDSAGATLQWTAKAATVTTTGFTLIVSGPAATWSGVEVQWTAIAVS